MAEAEDLPGRLRETDRAIGGVSIHLIRTHCGKDLAKAVVALKAASQESASEIERLTTRLDAVEKALGEAVSVASLLYQNSELCARNHHWTTGGFTMPGWLADASETIERARSALPQGEGK